MGTTSAALSCMGYGYEVKVRINGTDLGLGGGKSESRRLLSPSDPMQPDFAFRSKSKTSGRVDCTFSFGAAVTLSDVDAR